MRFWLTILAAITIALHLAGCYEDGSESSNNCNDIPFVQAAPWPQGRVYFHVDGSFDPADENDQYTLRMVRLAMREWSSAAKIEFIEMADAGEYICVIAKSDRNSSTVGYRKDPRVLLTTLASQRQATHEIGHLLGFTHEHQRPDRDLFITVLWENIRPEAAGQYELLDNALIDEGAYPYDYRSVMHYAQSSGTVSTWKETYLINNPDFDERWPTYLTGTDRRKAQDLYGPREVVETP